MDRDSFAISGALVVLADRVVEGWVEVEDGRIAA